MNRVQVVEGHAHPGRGELEIDIFLELKVVTAILPR